MNLVKINVSLTKFNIVLIIMSLLLFVNNTALAHETSFIALDMHYENVTETSNDLLPQLTASWHLTLGDLQQLVDMDIDKDQQILGWELRAQLPLIQERLNASVILPPQAHCQWSLSDFKVSPLDQKTDVTLDMSAQCRQAIHTLQISVPQDFLNPLLYQLNQKQGLVIKKGVVEPNEQSIIIELKSNRVQSGMDNTTNVSFFYFVLEGIKHILIGADHLVFLMLLLFSAVWRKGDLVEFNLPELKKLFAYTGCFTIAHSITLALGWWQLTPIPMKWIEVLIALTIVWSAVAVLKQQKPLSLSIVFIFGLIHGFGFASVLLDSKAADYYSTSTLIGFNVGVELGQFLFLCVSALLIRALSIKQTDYFARSGTVSALAVAGIWVFERATGLTLIS